MSSSLAIEASDSSGRWYLLPGAANSFELKLTNGSDHAVLCKLSLDEPGGAGKISPSSVTLKAGESRSVTLTFSPDWLSLRDRKAVVTARDAAGAVVATFVHDLVAATSTDCSVSLAWKDEIVGDAALRGFMLLCTVRSISSTPGVFEPEFASHPSLAFPEMQRITLGPGETASFDVPIIWNRSARDHEGWNHPRTIEVGVPVTHGRRSATAPWDIVQQHIEPWITDADREPVLARRPPPPQFTTPGGGPPPVSPMPVAPPEPTMGPPVTDSHAARIARSEMEAGVATGGMRLPPPLTPPSPPPTTPETISVAPGTLALIGLAFTAILIVLIWTLRSPNGGSVSTAPVPVASAPLPATLPTGAKHKAPPKGAHPGASQAGNAAGSSSGTAAQQAAAAAATEAPAAAAATHAAAAHAAPVQHAAAAPQRLSPIDRNSLVQLENVGAEYLRGGRYVHVYWDSYAQVRADVQLLDDRSTILTETTVGRKMAAVLRVPRGYAGPIYVSVTAYDFNGERVESSTSLGPP